MQAESKLPRLLPNSFVQFGSELEPKQGLQLHLTGAWCGLDLGVVPLSSPLPSPLGTCLLSGSCIHPEEGPPVQV